jgi:hypothetical protein
MTPYHVLGLSTATHVYLLFVASYNTPFVRSSIPCAYPVLLNPLVLPHTDGACANLRLNSGLPLLDMSCSFNMANERKTCAYCKTTAEARVLPCLQACAHCRTALYCGRDCQKANCKNHRKVCSKLVEHSNSYSAPRLPDFERHVPACSRDWMRARICTIDRKLTRSSFS